MKELELYIHIPFCVRKCAYCDFLSGPAGEPEREEYRRISKGNPKRRRYGEEGVRYQVFFLAEGRRPSLRRSRSAGFFVR